MAARSVNKLFISNLPWTVGTRELKHYFSEFGHVSSCNVVFDKNTGFSRGYGFVVFATPDAIDAAKGKTHNLEGNNISIRAQNA